MRAHRIASATTFGTFGTLVTTGALALAGCSADVAPGAAALDADGDVVVTVDEVESVSAELSEAFPQAADISSAVVFFSVIADDVREVARESDALVSVDETRRGVAEQTDVQLSEEAAEVVAVSTMFAQLAQGPQAEAVVERVSALDPVVNPRYGEWDAQQWQPGQNLPIVEAALPWLAEAEGEPTG
jgi:hypothetical protein